MIFFHLGGTPGTHLATDHEDTTEGAVHCFQDEMGNWHSYTFSQESAGTASIVVPPASGLRGPSGISASTASVMPMATPSSTSGGTKAVSRSSSSVSINSGLTVILDNPTIVFQPKTGPVSTHSSATGNGNPDGTSGGNGTTGAVGADQSTNEPMTTSERRLSRPHMQDAGEYWPSPTLLRIRRRRSPLHQFAESLLERTRLASASNTTAILGGMCLSRSSSDKFKND